MQNKSKWGKRRLSVSQNKPEKKKTTQNNKKCTKRRSKTRQHDPKQANDIKGGIKQVKTT